MCILNCYWKSIVSMLQCECCFIPVKAFGLCFDDDDDDEVDCYHTESGFAHVLDVGSLQPNKYIVSYY